MFVLDVRETDQLGATSSFPDGEVEGGAGLGRDAEVDRRVLTSSLVPVDGSQDLDYLRNTD